MTNPLRARRSTGTMIAASLISAVCGVVQTFWIPRLLSVEGYGYWRTFLLYMGYAGLLHLGLVDGALLSWSRHQAHKYLARMILGRSLQFIAVEHLVLLTLSAVLMLLPSAHALGHIIFALAVYALFFNVLVLLQVYFQAQVRFVPVAFGNSAPGALFVVFLALMALTRITVDRLLIAYLSAWAITLLVLLGLSLRDPTAAVSGASSSLAISPIPTSSSWSVGLAYIAAGWPIMLANTGFGVMQSADRVTVNLTRPIHDFAIYSLSQSTIYVPITLLAAISRVAFSYFVHTKHEGRAGIYRSSTRFLSLLWIMLLPYYFAVEYIVRRFLPKYVPGLPAGRILLFSVLFLSLIQIVQLNTYSVEGRQRQFFAGSIVAVVLAFATAWIGSRVIGTLSAVAWSQVITAMIWWLGNEYFLCRRTGSRWQDVLRVLLSFAIGGLVLAWVSRFKANPILSSLLYLAVVVPTSALLFRAEYSMLLRRIKRSPAVSA